MFRKKVKEIPQKVFIVEPFAEFYSNFSVFYNLFFQAIEVNIRFGSPRKTAYRAEVPHQTLPVANCRMPSQSGTVSANSLTFSSHAIYPLTAAVTGRDEGLSLKPTSCRLILGRLFRSTPPAACQRIGQDFCPVCQGDSPPLAANCVFCFYITSLLLFLFLNLPDDTVVLIFY